VSTFVKGQEDPHALIAKPSDVRKLAKADAFILLGLAMEAGWAPALIDRSKNTKVREGQLGYVDVSFAIDPIRVEDASTITRAMGDVHPEGNPHYMLDPVNGLKVARHLSATFSKLKPDSGSAFQKNLKNFEEQWGTSAFGSALAKSYPLDQLIGIQDMGKLELFLSKTGESQKLAGWFGSLSPLKGIDIVADHQQWDYFSKRFGVHIDQYVEPKPGVPPGSRYLKTLVEWMKAKEVKGILASAYFPPRTLNFIQKHSGAKILSSAHQVGARPQADTYLNMISHNVELIASCYR
jgi:ABC-type Zn uptake system ZnuABC Zn-binding protein ZnuA